MKKDILKFTILERIFEEIGGTFMKIYGNDVDFEFTTDDGIIFNGTIPSDMDIYSIYEELDNIVDYDNVMCNVEQQILETMINKYEYYMAENLLEIVSDWKKIEEAIEIEWNQFKSSFAEKLEDYLLQYCTLDEFCCKLNLDLIEVKEEICLGDILYTVFIDDEDGTKYVFSCFADCVNCAIAKTIEYLLVRYGYLNVESRWKDKFPCAFDEE